MTLQQIYSTCEYQGCQCSTCAHDHGGKCTADTGSCKGARKAQRCPIRGCPMYRAK